MMQTQDGCVDAVVSVLQSFAVEVAALVVVVLEVVVVVLLPWLVVDVEGREQVPLRCFSRKSVIRRTASVRQYP